MSGGQRDEETCTSILPRRHVRPEALFLLQFVKHVAAAGKIAGRGDRAGGFPPRLARKRVPAAATTFSSIIKLPMSLAPKRSDIWPISSPCVTQLACTLAKLSRYKPADGQRLQVFPGAALGQIGPGGMAGLKRPADKGGKTAASRPAIGATAPGVRSARPGFRRGRTSSSPSRGRPTRASARQTSSHWSAVALHGLTSRRTRSTRISAPPPGRLPKPAAFSRSRTVRTRQLRTRRNVDDFRRAEAVDVDLRESPLDVAEQLARTRPGQLGVQAALEQDLVAAQGDGLFDLAEQFFAAEDVALRIAGRAGKRAEAAAADADVGVVDVAIDVVGAVGLGVQPPAHGVGGAGQRRQVVRLQQPQPFVGRQPPAASAIIASNVAMVEDKCQFLAGLCQPVPRGQLEKQFQPLPLPRPQAELQVVAQVRQALGLRHAHHRGRLPGDLRQPGQALVAGRRQRLVQPPASRRRAGPPTTQTRTAAPSSASTPRPGPRRTRTGRPRGRIPRSPISITASAAQSAGRRADGKRLQRGRQAEALLAARSAPAPRWSASLRPGPGCQSAPSGTRL